MAINSFRDLRVWQAAIELVEHLYQLTQRFPKFEAFGLSSQMQRAAVSIPSNIAEGHTREHRKEFLHHLSVSQASLAELETQIEIAGRLKYLSEDQLLQILSEAAALGRQLHALRRALKSGTRSSRQGSAAGDPR
jgi:four helix bundle protein